MKKIAFIFLALAALFSAGGCSREQARSAQQTAELALITDVGTIDDKSFNQGAWEGLYKYASEKNITNRYYQPAEKSDDAYLASITMAVRGGAKVIVTPGYLFEPSVFIAQDRFPDVKFILLDGSPNNGDWTAGFPSYKTGSNTVAITYAEDQSGFLAGYAAVKDGYRSLGFMGGMAVPAVVRFGYGFIQGAEYAAQELRLTRGAVTVNYHYTGAFSASPEAQTMAASWFNSGIEVIFACGGALGNSVMAAAEQTGKKVIGVDVDQSRESNSVITSAMKLLQSSVYDSIAAFYSGRFPGGQDIVYSAANNGVGLPMDTSVFRTFTNADYDNVYRLLANGAIPRMMDDSAAEGSPRIVPVTITLVNEVR